MKIGLAAPSTSVELASFFATNLTPSYISHSELQGFRAADLAHWAPDIFELVRLEIEERIAAQDLDPQRPVLEGRVDGRLVALAMLSISQRALVPFAVLEDIVVDRAERGQGRGEEMLKWIRDYAFERGARRLFLESGIRNKLAHHFFERAGFETISIVMMADLGSAE